MLPTTYPASNYSFLVETKGAYRLVFVSEELKTRARTEHTEPLWYIELGDQRTLDAMVRWVRVRREFWDSWGKLATTGGSKLLAVHLGKLMEEDPPAESHGFIMTDDDEAEEALILGEALLTPSGVRKRVYHRHLFASVEHKEAFKNWLLSNNPEANGDAMLELALNQGTKALAEAIDKITADERAQA